MMGVVAGFLFPFIHGKPRRAASRTPGSRFALRGHHDEFGPLCESTLDLDSPDDGIVYVLPRRGQTTNH